MKYIKIGLLVWFILITLFVTAQPKKIEKNKKVTTLCGLIKGKWQAVDDPNVILLFGGNKMYEIYGKDTSAVYNFILSYSCDILKEIPVSVADLEKNAYVILYNKDGIDRCSELMDLNKNTLSWMNRKTGKIFVYNRKKAR